MTLTAADQPAPVGDAGHIHGRYRLNLRYLRPDIELLALLAVRELDNEPRGCFAAVGTLARNYLHTTRETAQRALSRLAGDGLVCRDDNGALRFTAPFRIDEPWVWVDRGLTARMHARYEAAGLPTRYLARHVCGYLVATYLIYTGQPVTARAVGDALGCSVKTGARILADLVTAGMLTRADGAPGMPAVYGLADHPEAGRSAVDNPRTPSQRDHTPPSQRDHTERRTPERRSSKEGDFSFSP